MRGRAYLSLDLGDVDHAFILQQSWCMRSGGESATAGTVPGNA